MSLFDLNRFMGTGLTLNTIHWGNVFCNFILEWFSQEVFIPENV